MATNSKMKLKIFGGIFLVFAIGIVCAIQITTLNNSGTLLTSENISLTTPSYCYQETANKSTVGDGTCALSYSGVYKCSSSGSFCSLNLYDGDWNTYSLITSNQNGNFYANYTTPQNFANAIWEVKYGNAATIYNYTLPYTCLNKSVVQLLVSVSTDSLGDGYNYGYCYNTTGWEQIYGLDGLTADTKFYEEALIWYDYSDSRNLTFPTHANFTSAYMNLSGYPYTNQNIVFNYTATIPITNCTDLQNIESNYTGLYYLANDIDCSDTVNWNGGLGFRPIGNMTGSSYLNGELDGRGHSIKNLYINRPNEDNVAIFVRLHRNINGVIGCFTSDIIANLNVLNASITGRDNVAILSGSQLSGRYQRIFLQGNVTGRNNVAGFTTGTYGGSSLCGNIIDSYVIANLTGNNSVGGIYAYVGGGGSATNAYFKGSINSNSSYGGIVGSGGGGLTISNCYYLNTSLNGTTLNAIGTLLTPSQSIQKNSYLGLNFSNLWTTNWDTKTPSFEVIPTSSYISINNTQIWSYAGEFSQVNNKTLNFVTTLNTALNNGNCNCFNCIISGTNCTIPFTFISYTKGILQYSDININYDSIPYTYLVSPSNNSYGNSPSSLTCNATDETKLSNMTLYVWNSTGFLNSSLVNNISGTSNQTTFSFNFPTNDAYTWNCLSTNNKSYTRFADSNYTINIVSAPVTTMNYPTDTQWINTKTNVDFNCSVVGSNLDTLFLYGNFSGTYKLNKTIVGISQGTIYNFKMNLTDASYKWTCAVNQTSGALTYSQYGNYTMSIDTVKSNFANLTTLNIISGSTVFDFNVTSTSRSPQLCKYNIWTGITPSVNISYNCNEQTTITAPGFGTYNLFVYSLNIAGENSTNTSFTTFITSPSGGGGGTPTNLTFCGDGICQTNENFYTCQLDCGGFNADYILNCFSGNETLKSKCLLTQGSSLIYVFIGVAIVVIIALVNTLYTGDKKKPYSNSNYQPRNKLTSIERKLLRK